MSESTRMLLGLAIGIALMIVLVMKTKVHTFIALLLAAIVTGLIGGMTPADITLADGTVQAGIITAIKDGFGNTLKSTGIIIGLGVMMGGILEKSGAAEKMAYSFIKAVGKKKEEWALAITGWFISIPVFADSAIVIFAPLCKAISKVTGKSLIGLALAMAAGLQLTHCLVPPTPGPLTAAGMLGVDVGQMIILGVAISIPMLIVAVFYCKWIGKKIYQIPLEDGKFERKEYKEEYIKSMEELDRLIGEKQLPGLWVSIAPIIIPLALILTKTVLNLVGIEEGAAYEVIALFGEPMEELWRVPKGDHCKVNQVLYHLGSRGIEYALLPWLKEHQVVMMAYCPLAQAGSLRRELTQNASVKQVARKNGLSEMQVLLAFVLYQENVIAIPKAGKPEHIQENAKMADFKLTEEDYQLLSNAFPAPKNKTYLDIV